MISFDEMDLPQTSNKNETKKIDTLGFIPQNSIDNHSFQSNLHQNYENNINNFAFIEPMDENDDTDYEYMGYFDF